MLNDTTNSEFINPATFLPSIPASRIFGLAKRWNTFFQTYKDYLSRQTVRGGSYSHWGTAYFEGDYTVAETFFDPADCPATLGRDALPWNSIAGPGGQWQCLPIWILAVDGEGDTQELAGWRESLRAVFPSVGSDTLTECLTIWIINGMFQIEITKTLNHVFCIDNRGRPVKVKA